MVETYTLEQELFAANIALWASLFVLFLSVAPVVFNYLVVNIPKWFNGVLDSWSKDVHWTAKIFWGIFVILFTVAVNHWIISLSVFFIVFMLLFNGFLRIFDVIYTDFPYPDAGVDVGYKIFYIEEIYNLYYYVECVSCDDDFVRERGWKAKIRFNNKRVRHIYICKCCAPKKVDAQEYFEEELIMDKVQDMILEPINKVTYWGTDGPPKTHNEIDTYTKHY